MKMKRVIAVFTTIIMTASMLAGCGTTKETGITAEDSAKQDSKGEETDNDKEGISSDLAGVEISFLNSKGEIQTGLEEMATAFEEETGIKVEIQVAGAGEVPYTKITSAYNAGTAPTMAMLDGTDIQALAKEYALDLSDESWVSEADTMKVDGTIYSFPFCIEGRGLIYNKAVIEKTLGEAFDPSTINSYDALKELLENLRKAGLENPVVLSKEDWSLGAHQLGFIYDTYDGTTEGASKIIESLKDGSQKPADYERFNEFVDTLDLLLEYNINGKDPLGALYEQDPIYLADGEAAIWPNGSWAWPNLEEADASTDDEYGFLPFVLGNDTSDFANTSIQASASKQVMIDKVQASEEQIAAAKEFLNWIVYNDNGQRMLVESCAVIPASSNNSYNPIDPLGRDIKAKMEAGKTFSSSFIAPSDHWSVMGAAMQKYIGNESSREELATSLEDYWTSQE